MKCTNATPYGRKMSGAYGVRTYTPPYRGECTYVHVQTPRTVYVRVRRPYET